jgi:hypothetical protein
MPFLMQWVIKKGLAAKILEKGVPIETCGSFDTKN